MISKFSFYFILKPLSLLPLPVLYLISDFLYLLIYHIVGYRKKVVFTNLYNSFPQKNTEEITEIATKFYKHFCDVMIESIKIFSISVQELGKRIKIRNPELANRFYYQGKSILVVGGHYNNWELYAVSCNTHTKLKFSGIYTPLSNKFFNKKMIESRSKFGTVLVPKKDVKKYFEQNKDKLTATVFGADQSPSATKKKTYWTRFLNQDTAVMFGSEKYAKEYNYPVLFIKIDKIKRGYYEGNFEIITEGPQSMAYGEITEKHTKALEEQILEKPEFWLWTHKRWKVKKEDVIREGSIISEESETDITTKQM
jgi:KDO2-lipid IV(A) lauroyltransferase